MLFVCFWDQILQSKLSCSQHLGETRSKYVNLNIPYVPQLLPLPYSLRMTRAPQRTTSMSCARPGPAQAHD